MRVVLAAVPYSDTSGGAMAIHKLCDLLLRAGVDCAMLPMDPRKFRTCNRYGAAIVTKVRPQDLLIYPERVEGNPYGAKHVARWVMYHTDPIKRQYGSRDVIVYYSDRFGDGHNLTAMDARLDLFVDRGEPRTGRCWTVRKGLRQGWAEADARAAGIEVPRGTSPQDLADLFNRSDRFVSFDNATFLSDQAALCGCDSIVMTKRSVLPKLGVAQGEDDLPRARNTRTQLRQYLIDQESRQGAEAVRTIEWIKGQL